MNPNNKIIVYLFFGNDLPSKKSISYDVHSKWTSLDNLHNFINKENCEIKYFDEEEELISIIENEDFLVFQNIVMNKLFPKNEIIVLAHNNKFNRNKFGSLKKIHNLKILKEKCESFTRPKPNSFVGDLSSSSSSSAELNRSKKHRSIKRYAAEIRNELNYLPGSEVSDGQTIFKKWRIKNTGLKKWKSNSVKCVLLPSEFSNWIQYENLNVPVCFADQKVDIEMQIKICGKWSVEQLSDPNCCQIVKLKWLLFIDKLVKERESHFIEFILAPLDLTINIKNRSQESVFNEPEVYNLQKQTSESSIEKIDQDFSIVDVSEDDEIKKPLSIHKPIVDSNPQLGNSKDITSDIELPDCPNGDDFQITDFHQPNNIITVEQDDREKNIFVDSDDSVLDLLTKSNPNCEIILLNEVANNIPELTTITKDNVDCIHEGGDINIVKSTEMKNQTTLIENDKVTESIVIVDREKVTNPNLKENNKILTDSETTQLFKHSTNEVPETIEIPENLDKSTESKPISSNNILSNGNIEHSLVFGQFDQPDITPLLNKDKNSSENMKILKDNMYNPVINNSPVLGPKEWSTNSTTTYSPYQYGNNQNTYMAGQVPNNYKPCVPNAPPFTYGANFDPTVPPININCTVPIQNQSSNKLIQELAKHGNIHNNINDSKWVRAPDGNHHEINLNISKLDEMGFHDKNLNYRLLQKFENNVQDVINELID